MEVGFCVGRVWYEGGVMGEELGDVMVLGRPSSDGLYPEVGDVDLV